MQNEILEEPSPPGAEDVTAGLRAHLVERTGALPWIPLTLLLRDNDNRVRGGIKGYRPVLAASGPFLGR